MKIEITPAELAELIRLVAAPDMPAKPDLLARDPEQRDHLTEADRNVLTAMAELGAVGKDGKTWETIAAHAGYASPKRNRLKSAGLIQATDGPSRGMALTAAGVEYERAMRVGVDIGTKNADNH